MSTAGERRRALTYSLALVSVIGAVVTAGALLVPQLALVFVGGQQFEEISDHLWIFAVLGTVLSMLQLLVYSVLARQGQRSVYLVWAAFISLVAFGLTSDSLARPVVGRDHGGLAAAGRAARRQPARHPAGAGRGAGQPA